MKASYELLLTGWAFRFLGSGHHPSGATIVLGLWLGVGLGPGLLFSHLCVHITCTLSVISTYLVHVGDINARLIVAIRIVNCAYL